VPFEQPHRGAHHFALGLEAAGIDLLGDEALEVFTQGDAGVSRHDGSFLG